MSADVKRTEFQTALAEVRKDQQQTLKSLVQEKVDALAPKMEKDLTGKGYKVLSVEGSGAAYRGNPYFSSFKIFLEHCRTPNQVVSFLQAKYSPKFQDRGVRDGGHLFSIR